MIKKEVFQKTPLPGHIVKVYFNNEEDTVAFGEVLFTKIRMNREIVVLRELNKDPNTREIDFYFDKNVCVFE